MLPSKEKKELEKRIIQIEEEIQMSRNLIEKIKKVESNYKYLCQDIYIDISKSENILKELKITYKNLR